MGRLNNNSNNINFRLVTKKEIVSRIVTVLKEKYHLPVYEIEWFGIFKKFKTK